MGCFSLSVCVGIAASVCGYSFSFDIIFKVFTNMERKTTSREDFCKLLESLVGPCGCVFRLSDQVFPS